jgi:AraC-like DNA-binding protein
MKKRKTAARRKALTKPRAKKRKAARSDKRELATSQPSAREPRPSAQVFHRRAPWSHWMNVRTNLFWIYDGDVPAEGRKGKFNEGVLSAWLLRRGQVVVEHDGQKITASAGEWLIPWPGLKFQEFSEDAALLSIRFQAAWPDGQPLFSKGLSVAFPARYHPDLEASATHLLELVQSNSPKAALSLTAVGIGMDEFLQIKAALMKFVAVFYRVMCAIGLQPARIGLRDERVISALQQLDTLDLSHRIQKAPLAMNAGLSPSQFVRLFRDEVGYTPKQYLERRRLSFAEQMVAGTSVPIKEICYNLGFVRLSDFSAWFKNNFNISPRGFRTQSPHLPRAQGEGLASELENTATRRDVPSV